MMISLIVAAAFGAFCAYGTSSVEIPGFEVTMPYLVTIFYSRLLMGFAIGFADHWILLKRQFLNAIIRGAMIGAIFSIGISFYGGAVPFISFGIIYGIITDLAATIFSS
jgi:hypothetical protein